MCPTVSDELIMSIIVSINLSKTSEKLSAYACVCLEMCGMCICMAPISEAMLEILDRLDLEVHLASGEHEALEILREKNKRQ